jgi:hypothetical protein
MEQVNQADSENQKSCPVLKESWISTIVDHVRSCAEAMAEHERHREKIETDNEGAKMDDIARPHR